MAKRTCTVEGCERPFDARDFCRAHYARYMKYGPRSLKWPHNDRPAYDRFFGKIKPAPRWACWEWQGGLKENGYGRIRHNRRDMYVHRFAYEWFVGPIPDGMEIDHICNVRHCVNPEHLQATTHERNVQYIWERSSRCRNGLHPKPSGDRCMDCDDAREGRWGQYVEDEGYVVTGQRGLIHRVVSRNGALEPRCMSFALDPASGMSLSLPSGRRCSNCFREPRGQRL